MSLYEGVIPNFSPENIVLWLRHSILILLFIYLHDPIQTKTYFITTVPNS